ncbi:MAG: DNA repair protein RecO [Patescibacteria group bacterium]|nr:DNA repair protein RecO [Patescibacteria group bacterium]MBU1877283.1 DNA repair protein RecO [Patescibacteria group bacterium]
MAIRYRALGFILKKQDIREADQLFTVYTQNTGKIKILAKAIRKIDAKLKGNFQLFNLIELEFIQGKNHKTLVNALNVGEFVRIKKDLKRMKAGYQIAEILDGLVRKEQEEKKIWELLEETLTRLNNLNLSLNRLRLLYYYFFWNLVSILGYEPQVYKCVFCHKKLIPTGLMFVPEVGGIICSGCFEKSQKDESISIEAESIKIIRLILKKNWIILSKLKITKDNLINMQEVSSMFFNFLSN